MSTLGGMIRHSRYSRRSSNNGPTFSDEKEAEKYEAKQRELSKIKRTCFCIRGAFHCNGSCRK